MSVIKSAITVSVFTFLSRLLGFARECCFTAFLGISSALDCFFIAVRLANTCRKIFAEGAFNASFLPRFSSVLENKDLNEANVLLSKIFSLMLVAITVFSLVIIAIYPQVISVLASGFKNDPLKFERTVDLGRLMFPFLLFVSITALFCGVSNAVKKFALPACIFSLVNVFSIVTVTACFICGAGIEETIFWLSISVVLSGVAQVIIMWWYVLAHGFKIRFTTDFLSPDVNVILKNMIPGLIGAGVWQINMLIDMQICSYLPTGTISCFNFADKLNQFPLAMIGTAIGTAMLPTLSSAFSKKNFKLANEEFERGILFAMLFALPACVCLFSLAQPAVSLAYERIKFSSEHVIMTAMALQGFVIGLPANVLAKIFSSVFFANGDTKTPVQCAALSVALNIIFLILLVPFGRIFCVPLSTALAAFVNALSLAFLLFTRCQLSISKEFYKKLSIQLTASILLFCELQIACKHIWDPIYGSSYLKWKYGLLLGFIAIISYGVLLIICAKIFGSKNQKLLDPKSWIIK